MTALTQMTSMGDDVYGYDQDVNVRTGMSRMHPALGQDGSNILRFAMTCLAIFSSQSNNWVFRLLYLPLVASVCLNITHTCTGPVPKAQSLV